VRPPLTESRTPAYRHPHSSRQPTRPISFFDLEFCKNGDKGATDSSNDTDATLVDDAAAPGSMESDSPAVLHDGC
jgi:hypothetical protein